MPYVDPKMHLAAVARYKRSLKGQATQARYWKSPKGRATNLAAVVRYQKSPKGLVTAIAYRSRLVTFKGSQVAVAVNPRIGTCSNCGRKRRPDERQFNMHHHRYIPSNPLAFTRELCPKCHRIEHVELRRAAAVRSLRRSIGLDWVTV